MRWYYKVETEQPFLPQEKAIITLLNSQSFSSFRLPLQSLVSAQWDIFMHQVHAEYQTRFLVDFLHASKNVENMASKFLMFHFGLLGWPWFDDSKP